MVTIDISGRSRHPTGALATMSAIVGAKRAVPAPGAGAEATVEQRLEWKRSGFEQPSGTSVGQIFF